jgi:ADP-ribose pyrophosphatase
MITLKNYTAAFLQNGDKYLLMKRADNRKVNPGIWSGVGGKIEPHEINNPLAACYREIEEETGIPCDKIISLDLQYIITRRSENEIRQSYIYFGKTDVIDIVQTDEGILFWVSSGDLLNKEYTATYAAMLEHYIKRKPTDNAVYVGVAENADSELRMNWSLL